MADQPDPAKTAGGFFRSRWLGTVPIERLFWMDMIVVGTAINIATSFAALVVLGLKWPVWASIVVYLAPLPYNLFLVAAIWRTVDRSHARTAGVVRSAALAWIVIATLI